MDKLTQLIQEAKPLYKRRKRNKIIISTFIILVVPISFFVSITNLYIKGNEIYTAMNSSSFQAQLLENDFGLK